MRYVVRLFFAFLINIKSGTVFQDIIKLSKEDDYFVILSSGFYLYNYNLLGCSRILSFNSTIYKNSNNAIILKKIEDDHNLYVLSLVNNYLFIFDFHKNKFISFNLNDIDASKESYCNLMPYKIQNNNIIFIIVTTKDSDLNFYIYDFDVAKKELTRNESSFDHNTIKYKKLNCQIIPYLSNIVCFHNKTQDNQYYLSSTIFKIEDMKITSEETYNYNIDDYVNQVKSVLSFNNKFFICLSSGSIRRLICYINDISIAINNLEKVNCTFGTNFSPNYKIFYFNETGDFLTTARGSLETGMINSISNSIIYCHYFKLFTKQDSKVDDYSIIYNNSIKQYQLVNYTNFDNSEQCKDNSLITSFDEIPTTELMIENHISQISTNNINNIIPKTNINIISNSSYIKEVTTKTKEEIFNNIENILTDKQIGINYEIKGEDFTIIIKPTNSTPLPNTTHVEFDECEKIIRKENNISNSSIITFLQI